MRDSKKELLAGQSVGQGAEAHSFVVVFAIHTVFLRGNGGSTLRHLLWRAIGKKGERKKRQGSKFRSLESFSLLPFIQRPTMVCNSASSECAIKVDKDVTLKQALEELLKCMLRVWCRESQALARFGASTTGNAPEKEVKIRRLCISIDRNEH